MILKSQIEYTVLGGYERKHTLLPNLIIDNVVHVNDIKIILSPLITIDINISQKSTEDNRKQQRKMKKMNKRLSTGEQYFSY